MSALEEELAFQLTALGAPAWEREYVFAAPRRFRLDFSWPAVKLGVEVQGGTYMRKGGHNTGGGLSRDYEKLDLAVELGWRVLFYDAKRVRMGEAVLQIMRVLGKLEVGNE